MVKVSIENYWIFLILKIIYFCNLRTLKLRNLWLRDSKIIEIYLKYEKKSMKIALWNMSHQKIKK